MSQATQSVETYNPATGELHKKYTPHTQAEAEAIVEKAHQAFLSWRNTDLDERAKIVKNIGEHLTQNKDRLSRMMAQQMGKPLAVGEQEVALCAQICQYTAEQGPKELKSEIRELEQGHAVISYEPLGVIFAMQPWNFPCYQVVRYSIANIMAGNSTVLKHSKICWETAEALQNIYVEAGLPENVFSVIYVDNKTADALIAHDKVRGVTLTGSAAAGKIVAEAAGKNLKKVLLELGGSDPYLVLEDANLDEAIEICVKGRINNSGQTCVAAKRFIVLDAIYDDFKKGFVAAMKKVRTGDPFEKDTQMGPLARKDLRENLHEQVRDSVNAGATVLCGGEIPEGKGYYYPATVLENVKPGMPAYDDELFGPVASLIRAKDEDDAVRIANDHRYGLGGGVFSGNADRAMKLAHRLETGMVNINGYNLAQPNLPFGGVKDSGYGREHGGFGLKEFVNIKSIVVSG
jgi:succinate-semialdehyde dehydrogenase / glutarate-semialdehyde dehydrogenase